MLSFKHCPLWRGSALMSPVLCCICGNRNKQCLSTISPTRTSRRWRDHVVKFSFFHPSQSEIPQKLGALWCSRLFPQQLLWHLAPFTQSSHCCRKWGSCDHLAPSTAWHLCGRRNFFSLTIDSDHKPGPFQRNSFHRMTLPRGKN